MLPSEQTTAFSKQTERINRAGSTISEAQDLNTITVVLQDSGMACEMHTDGLNKWLAYFTAVTSGRLVSLK